MNNQLPNKWQIFVDNLNVPPGRPQAAFEYGLAVILAEIGDLERVGPELFRAADGYEFSLARPELGAAEETMLLAHMRWLLGAGTGGR